MKRRDFFTHSSVFGLGLVAHSGTVSPSLQRKRTELKKKAKNIIFLVSDGMSAGTLQMADLFNRMKNGWRSNWMQLYQDQKLTRGLMETASADSYVTDSAAASSAWGGGVSVKNGRLNVGSGNQHHKPIWQKFQSAGKKVGCVTTVPITHATPAGFCISHKTRDAQDKIAELYLPRKFDVMLGGGEEYFFDQDRKGRTDSRNLFDEFKQAGYHVVRSRAELQALPPDPIPVLGVFHKSGLPYTIDQLADKSLLESIPTLSEMTEFAIKRMQDHPEGFVLQVEAGKVDWAAHANDTSALIYDQLAFDDAIKTVMDFAEQNQETLVVITTDHSTANPGILGCDGSLKNFARLMKFKHSHGWIMSGLNQNSTPAQIIERIDHALGIAITKEQAETISKHMIALTDEELYNDYKLPYQLMAEILESYTSVAWAGDDHTGDFVELALFGPGSELLPPFIKNTMLHNFMLNVTECVGELVTQ